MSVKNRFQYQVATGRLTLPVAILLSLVFCGISFQGWESLGAWFMCACVTYLIIELNTTFALIRTRTSLPSAFFLVCFSVCPFLHTFGAGTFLPLLFIGMLFSLFRSFESPSASTTIYHAFCCVGIIGIIVPQTLYLTPVLIQLRSLNPRTFFAGVLGLLTPYWLGSCYLLYKGNWLERAREFRQQLIPVISDYNLLGWDQYLSLGILLVITLLCTAQSLTQTYQDKVQTRILLRTLMALEIIIIAFILLLPASFNGLFPMLLICSSVFFGHFFALVFNRFTQISLWIIFILLGIMTLLSDGMGVHRYVHFRLSGRNHPALQLRSRITGLHRTGTGPDMVYPLHHCRKRFGWTDLLLDRTSGQNGMDRKILKSRQETTG